MIVRPAEIFDARSFEYDGGELAMIGAFDWRLQLENYLAAGPAWVFSYESEDFVIGGYYELSPGVLQLWMLFNKKAKAFVKSLAKEFRKILDEAMKDRKVHRIQALIDETKSVDKNFAIFFGFKREALLEAFGPNREDLTIYKMVKPCHS